MKKYSRLGRTVFLLSASLLTWPLVPLSYGQTAAAADAAANPTPPAPQPPAPEKKIPVENAPSAVSSEEETVVLSPFEVSTSNKGYYSASTMSGTRLNSKIEDLGQSITVMTKQQMTDFGALDINDVFDLMASTEGTSSYSNFEIDRTGAVVDNVAGNPNNANRVRGIGNANVAFNNIETMGRVAINPLWIDSLELSRGPNANIFGLGNTSGTVNQVAATGNLLKDFSRLELRGDSYGGWQTSLDVNRRLLGNKLALRASYSKQHIGFIRKPSGEDSRRTSIQIKAQPFKSTTLSLGWYGYKNTSVRPNFTTPRDYITAWQAAGKPGWNPSTGLLTLNGVTYGQGTGSVPVAGSTTPWTSTPPGLPLTGQDNRAIFRVGGPGEEPYWTTPQMTLLAVSAPPSPVPVLPMRSPRIGMRDPLSGTNHPSGTYIARYLNTVATNSFAAGTQPLFGATPALADKSVYDWNEYNLKATDKAWDDVNIYLAQLDQIFINTQKHTLAAQATFMREDSNRWEDMPMGPASVNSTIGQLMADPNIANLDGSPNPYFGRPYLRTTEPFLKEIPQRWDTSRAQAVYKVDFSRDKGWSKWIGTQQLLGYYEYKDRQNRQYTYRHTATSLDQEWQQYYASRNVPLGNRTSTNVDPRYPLAPSNGVAINGNNFGRSYEQFYVGNTPGGGVEYAPSLFPQGATIPFHWGNPAEGWRSDMTTIGYTPASDAGGGQANVQTIIKTVGAVLQSTFLNGQLVATVGLRKDSVFDRNAPFATLSPDLRAYDRGLSDLWLPAWRKAEGNTETLSLVARPFKQINYLKAQASRGSGIKRFFAQAITGLGLTYNGSENFIPQGPAVDLFLRPLPNQTGDSKDIGFWLTTLDGNLTIRYVHFATNERDKRNGDINTIAQRVLRIDGLVSSDRWNLQDRSTNWISALNPTWTTDQVRAESNRVMGLTDEQATALDAANTAGTLAATQDIEAKGDELEINYNPTPGWTVSASVTKTESINKNAASTIEDWIAFRMPIWTTIEDKRFTQTTYTPASPALPTTFANNGLPLGPGGNLLWWTIAGRSVEVGGYDRTNSASVNFAGNVRAPLLVYRQLENKPRPQLRKYTFKFNTKYQLSGITDNKILKNVAIGGSLRWTDKAAIGFYGKGYEVGQTPATMPRIEEFDTSRPIYTPAERYIDLFISYKTKMFKDRIRATYQFNVKNVGEKGGGLLATAAFPDGTPLAYRIIDPRQFILSASFDL